MKQIAFFGEMTYDLTDKWSITGGARWFEFDRDMFDPTSAARACRSSDSAGGA